MWELDCEEGLEATHIHRRIGSWVGGSGEFSSGSCEGGQQSSGQGCGACKHCSVTCWNFLECVVQENRLHSDFIFWKVETLRLLGNESVYLYSQKATEIWAQILYMQYSKFSTTLKSNVGILTSLQSLIEIGYNENYLFKWETKEIRVFYQCIFNLYPWVYFLNNYIPHEMLLGSICSPFDY